MAAIAHSLIDLIGDTPLLLPERYARQQGLQARLLLKLESFNPLGSVKDRVALALVEAAEESGQLAPGGVLIEPTGGSAGIALAFIGTVRGYRVILTMPDTTDGQRRELLKALGAEVVLTPGERGMAGAIAAAEELAAQLPGAYMPHQFDNPANPDIHRRTTAQEIWRDAEGKVDIFVAGVGTGGTLTGIGEALRTHNPQLRVVAVEPADSPVLSGGRRGAHKLQGIGAGFAPPVLNRDVYDEVMTVRSDEAFTACRDIAHAEALLLGASSGAALHAATQLARRAENRGKTVVAIMPDTGERYLSTNLFD